MTTDQCVLEYRGFSARRARCHVVAHRESMSALVGDPIDNPGTSVTNAIEHVAYDLLESLQIDVRQGRLLQFVPWDPRLRMESVSVIEFRRAEAWAMPVWMSTPAQDDFLQTALAHVHAVQPYALKKMKSLKVINAIVRVRVEATWEAFEVLSSIGTLQHISQRRVFYVDIEALSDDEAILKVRQALPHVPPDRIVAVPPGAPLQHETGGSL